MEGIDGHEVDLEIQGEAAVADLRRIIVLERNEVDGLELRRKEGNRRGPL